jgi:hypothetical protein
MLTVLKCPTFSCLRFIFIRCILYVLFYVNPYVLLFTIDIALDRCTLQHISKIRIEIHQVQQCFSNKIKPLQVSATDGHHRKGANTSKEMFHVYYMHVVFYGLH